MSEDVSRRGFLKGSAVAAAAAVGLSFEEQNLLAAMNAPAQAAAPPEPAGAFPTGRIGPLTVTRVLCGGNLISSFAHSRDLAYVSALLKRYFTDEKVLDTLELCEERGINTGILRVDDHIVPLITKYWRERGGKLQWIAQVKPTEQDPVGDINRAIDAGAVGVYLHGGVGDDIVQKGRLELAEKTLELGRKRGVVVGLGGHRIETIIAYEKAGLEPDFYMKTFNNRQYWSAHAASENDNIWELEPEKTIAFMRACKRPWIAFKIFAAGAIQPQVGFQYAFEHGADFCCVGMFDFQVVEDVLIARNVLAKIGSRERAWA